MKKLTDFKNEILCNYIHNEERYPRVNDLFENARVMLLFKDPKKPYMENSYDAHSLYVLLASNVERYKNIIGLCGCLKSKNAFKVGLVKENETYYEDFFGAKIKNAKMYMRKLRPYVLKYTESWSTERKQKDCELPEVGKHFNKWYLINNN